MSCPEMPSVDFKGQLSKRQVHILVEDPIQLVKFANLHVDAKTEIWIQRLSFEFFLAYQQRKESEEKENGHCIGYEVVGIFQKYFKFIVKVCQTYWRISKNIKFREFRCRSHRPRYLRIIPDSSSLSFRSIVGTPTYFPSVVRIGQGILPIAGEDWNYAAKNFHFLQQNFPDLRNHQGLRVSFWIHLFYFFIQKCRQDFSVGRMPGH